MDACTVTAIGFGSIHECKHFKVFVFLSEQHGSPLSIMQPQAAACDRVSASAGNNAESADRRPALPSNAYTRLVAGISDARGVLESALGVAHHPVHLVPINVPWDNHDLLLGTLFGIVPE